MQTFGVNGAVDLMKELNVDFDHVSRIGNSSPPMVYRDTVIVPPALEEGFVPSSMRNTPGYVMAFDARTGKQKWAFHTVPKNGEFGAETWEQNANAYTGNTGVWAPISVDPELGYAYLPGRNADRRLLWRSSSRQQSVRQFGRRRRSRDRQAHLALPDHASRHLELRPARPLRRWSNMTVNGRPVKALVQLTKQGYAYVLDRVTGQPVWPIEERAVPASDVPGERAWPTQPHPTKPAPYDYQGYNENDLIDFTPALRAEAIRIAKQYRLGPLFTPPSEIKDNGTKGTWYNPAAPAARSGRAAASIPRRTTSTSRSKTGPGVVTVRNDPKSDLRYSRGPGANLSVQGLPILKPPYSRITALDLNTGDYAWMVPLGTTPERVVAASGARGHHSAEHRRHRPARDTSRHQDAADRRRRLGRRAGHPRLRQEDGRGPRRAPHSRPDGQHADDLHGGRQAIHRLHRRRADAARGAHRARAPVKAAKHIARGRCVARRPR